MKTLVGLLLFGCSVPLNAQHNCKQSGQLHADHSSFAGEQQTLTDYGISLRPTVLEPDSRTFHIELALDSTDTVLDSIRFQHCSPFILLDELTQKGETFTSVTLRDDGIGQDAVAGDFRFTSDVITYIGSFQLSAGVKKFELCTGTGFEPDGAEVPRLGNGIFGLRLSPRPLSEEQPEELHPRLFALDHVVNFVREGTKQAGSRDSTLFATVFDHLDDRYDFLTILHAHGLGGYNRYGSLYEVSNSVVGFSNPPRIFDFTDDYGGASRLKAVATLLPYVEHSGQTFLHELNHVYGGENTSALRLGSNHYDDVLFVREGSGFGQFPVYDITPLNGNRFDVDIEYTSRVTYSNLELYQMGMLPLDSVEFPIKVLQNPQLETSSVYTADTLTLVEKDSMLFYHGDRIPAFGDAPTTWNMLFVVISDYPLPAKELAWFDEVSKAAMSSDSQTDFARHTFHQATNGHGRLDTRVRFPISKTENALDGKRANLLVAPNPSDAQISILSPVDKDLKWTIRDRTGRSLLNGYGLSIDVSSLSSGLYLLSTEEKSETQSCTFIKL